MADFHDSLDKALAAAEWSSADLHRDRADVPGHTMTTTTALGGRLAIRCECGWSSEPMHLSNLCGARNRHRIEASTPVTPVAETQLDEAEPATAQVLEVHESSREESRDFIRVTCSCGWAGAWHYAYGRTISNLLRSDDNGHIFAVRRGQA